MKTYMKMSWSKQNNLLDPNLAPQNLNSETLKGHLPQQVEFENSSHALGVSL